MVVIYTGKHEVDKLLEENIKGSMAISYLDFVIENEKFEGQTAIIAAQEIEKDKFESYLFTLRKLNIRVILLFNSEREDRDKLKQALNLGVYDLVFGNFYPSEIKRLVENPKNFMDISKIYMKVNNLKIPKMRKPKI